MLEVTPEDVVSEEGRELGTHLLIFFSLQHCKQLWHFQLQQVYHQVSSPALVMVTLCHRLEEVQEIVVSMCTTRPVAFGESRRGSIMYAS